MIFEFGKRYIVDVTEKGIVPSEEFDEDRWYDKDHDDLDFLTDEEKDLVINTVLDKIRAEIDAESVKSFKYPNWERAKALEWVLSVIDKYRAESEEKQW